MDTSKHPSNTVVDSELDKQLDTYAFYQNPYPYYHQLRQETPVAWSETLGGWVLTRYEDIQKTLHDPQHFSSQGRFSAAIERFPDTTRTQLEPLENHFTVGLIASDPPNHTRLRALVNKAFTPRVVERLRPRIQQLVNDLLDQVENRAEMDIIQDLAYPLPATVIAELIGAPPEARDQFKVWSDGILSFQGRGVVSSELMLQAQGHLLEMRSFLSELMEDRRRHIQDDLLSRLVETEMEGDRLTETELLTTCVTLLTAGHETTTTLITNGLYTLLTHPDQLEQLRANPSLMPTAIEEILRYESPLQRNPRRVAEDIEFERQSMQKGDYVLQILGAANRDPDIFPDPDTFDITRRPNRQMAFGYGVHFCVGAPLARLEAPIAIRSVLDRMPHLRLATQEPEWNQHALIRGLRTLRVEFN
jgi:cytochrome P450